MHGGLVKWVLPIGPVEILVYLAGDRVLGYLVIQNPGRQISVVQPNLGVVDLDLAIDGSDQCRKEFLATERTYSPGYIPVPFT